MDLWRADGGDRPRVRGRRNPGRRRRRIHAQRAPDRAGHVVQRRPLQRDVAVRRTSVRSSTGVFREKSEDAFTGGFDYNLRWDRQPHALQRPLGRDARARDRRHEDERRRRHELQLLAEASQHRRALRSLRPRFPRQRHRLSSGRAPIATRPTATPRSANRIPGRASGESGASPATARAGPTSGFCCIERYFEAAFGAVPQLLERHRRRRPKGRRLRRSRHARRPADRQARRRFRVLQRQQRFAQELASEFRREQVEEPTSAVVAATRARRLVPADRIASRPRCRPTTTRATTSRSGSRIEDADGDGVTDHVYGTLTATWST